ncbi:NAD(P)-dependent alcohol dehydrogenase [Methylovorus sp. MP688]|uniref:NAD(P)-dependent alcohol dehydrogenase n=1 Tax=Methylovorus sp. (strain MP688) TaxID=887061 RepID=UPI0001EC46D0|nr:NAD(P)-dependent alcohol dehydrogenase [Methylovorus sp. MP688]ADQ84429.1 zinc-binding alcohol dehydrogenase family protein [Methylovorus sp. MP688]
MKRIQYHRYGGPEVMRLESFVPDAPAKDEVAIAVHFAALNPVDWKVRNGAMKIVTGKSFPRAMGLDLSGTVTAVGADVSRFRVGDAVFGMARFKEAGALGEVAIAKENALARIPEGIRFEDAACLPTVGVVAWNALVDKAKVRPGQNVFINGCAGAVGQAAVQIARMFGARVSGSCSADSIDTARLLGVSDVYDYATTDLATLQGAYDIVFDAAGTIPTSVGIRMLRKKGTFATVEPTPMRFLRALFDRRLKPIVGTPRADVLERLGSAVASNALTLPIADIVPLAKAIYLIASVEGGRRLRGKALVTME